MAVKKTPEVEAVLDADDIWGELVAENAIPPLKVKGIVLYAPTLKQLETYAAAETEESAERALFGDHYEELKALFVEQPGYVWGNFTKRYKQHMFGVGDDEALKG